MQGRLHGLSEGLREHHPSWGGQVRSLVSQCGLAQHLHYNIDTCPSSDFPTLNPKFPWFSLAESRSFGSPGHGINEAFFFPA